MYKFIISEIVRNYEDFKDLIEKEFKENNAFPGLISFDHDLADEHYVSEKKDLEYKEKTGLYCAKFIIDFCLDNNLYLPEYIVHSQNPAGKANIVGLLDNFKKFKQQQ